MNCDNCHKCIDKNYKKDKKAGIIPASILLTKYSRFVICPDCGNKRCPKATHHKLECSGSNEPGQTGSVYQ